MRNPLITSLLVFLLGVAGSGLAVAQDFDGNGVSDLAIGVPYHDYSPFSDFDAGAVDVIYGKPNGLTSAGYQLFYWRGAHEHAGTALGVGDFNGDGFSDLAIGIPDHDVGVINESGAVSVIFGSRWPLTSVGGQYWDQNEEGIADWAEEGDHFGRALAVGDFNGDGFDDLAIGVPDEDIRFQSSTAFDCGAIQVLYGSVDGLSPPSSFWSQGVMAGTGDRYGATLASGDFDDDGYDDLAVGVPSENLGSIANAGMVEILYGSGTGLRRRLSNDLWHQDRSHVGDTAEANDGFGSALTTGDFNHDGFADLAVGVPYEDVGSAAVDDAGAVNVLYGSATGITGDNSDFWHQDIGSIHSLAEERDRFGYALTSGDFDADGYQDLAVGVPHEDWNLVDTGIVQVLYGSSGGLTDVGNQIWRQDTSGILDVEEAYDRFGFALGAGDYNGDGYADLAVGVPFESVGDREMTGIVHVLLGTPFGLTAIGDQVWHRGVEGMLGLLRTGDRFGYALASDTRQVFPMFDDGFESGDCSRWSIEVP